MKHGRYMKLAVVLSLYGLADAHTLAAQPAQAPAPLLPYGMPINGDQAQQAMTAAEALARKNNWSLALAVVDTNGNLVMFKHMTGAGPLSGEIAIRKAKTAAAFRATSKNFADRAAANPVISQIFPQFLPAEGGVPIAVDGKVIGAIAGSGATGAQDAEAAALGAAAVR